MEKFEFSLIADNHALVSLASSDAFTGNLLNTANALAAVVAETGDSNAHRQLNQLAWQLCKRSGGGICQPATNCQESCRLVDQHAASA